MRPVGGPRSSLAALALCREDCPVGRQPSPNHPPYQSNITTVTVWGRGCTLGSAPQEWGFQLEQKVGRRVKSVLGSGNGVCQSPVVVGGQV